MLILHKLFQILEKEMTFSNTTYETIIVYYDTKTRQRFYREKNKYPSRR